MDDHPADGGPAFPCDERHGDYPGMSLRDYLAAHAPDDLLEEFYDTQEDAAASLGWGVNKYRKDNGWVIVEAKLRYHWADTMLHARER